MNFEHNTQQMRDGAQIVAQGVTSKETSDYFNEEISLCQLTMIRPCSLRT